MVTLTELEEQVMALPDSERALLATYILRTLPPASDTEEDEEVVEALRRDAEMEDDPSSGLTMDELKRAIGR